MAPSDDVINPLGTSRYGAYQPWMGVPVAISVGKPAWMPGVEKINSLCPWGLLKIATDFEFRLKYEEQLERREDEIHRSLVALSRKYPGQRLVLLCWEDTLAGNGPCHRDDVADFLRAKGLEISEINPADRPDETPRPEPARPAAKPESPTLF